MARFHAARPEALTIGIMSTDRPRERPASRSTRVGAASGSRKRAEHPGSNLSNGRVYVTSCEGFDLHAAGSTDGLDFGYHVLPRMVGRMAAVRFASS
jgi:hypothetical protein